MWKKGHPANHCKKPKKVTKRDSDEDNRSVESTADSVRKLEKYLKLMKNNFATVNTQLTQLKEAADGYCGIRGRLSSLVEFCAG